MIDIFKNNRYNILDFGVWRSLVSRLVRVQEASGSNPDTPTIGKHWKCMFPVLFLTLSHIFVLPCASGKQKVNNLYIKFYSDPIFTAYDSIG